MQQNCIFVSHYHIPIFNPISYSFLVLPPLCLHLHLLSIVGPPLHYNNPIRPLKKNVSSHTELRSAELDKDDEEEKDDDEEEKDVTEKRTVEETYRSFH